MGRAKMCRKDEGRGERRETKTKVSKLPAARWMGYSLIFYM